MKDTPTAQHTENLGISRGGCRRSSSNTRQRPNLCAGARALLTAFTTAATLLIVVNVYSTAQRRQASSHDIAVSVLKHRTLMPIPDSATSKSDVSRHPRRV